MKPSESNYLKLLRRFDSGKETADDKRALKALMCNTNRSFGYSVILYDLFGVVAPPPLCLNASSLFRTWYDEDKQKLVNYLHGDGNLDEIKKEKPGRYMPNIIENKARAYFETAGIWPLAYHALTELATDAFVKSNSHTTESDVSFSVFSQRLCGPFKSMSWVPWAAMFFGPSLATVLRKKGITAPVIFGVCPKECPKWDKRTNFIRFKGGGKDFVRSIAELEDADFLKAIACSNHKRVVEARTPKAVMSEVDQLIQYKEIRA